MTYKALACICSLMIMPFSFISSRTNVNSRDSIPFSIDSILQESEKEDLFPGISIALITKDSVNYYNAGFANLTKGNSVKPNTQFQLGSVGKILTAIAIMQMVDRNQLNINEDVSKYLKTLDIPFDKAGITIHCLLTHSCGFNDVNIGYMAADTSMVISLRNFCKKYYPGNFQEPGLEITYSNYGYSILGLIVEIASQTEFKSYIQQNIFDPLQMNESTLEFPVQYKNFDNYANSYNFQEGEFVETTIYPRHATPAGSLVSNAIDMSKLLIAITTRDTNVLSKSSWEELFKVKFTNHPLLNSYSYGFEQQNTNGHKYWAKGGMLPGMMSHIVILPNNDALFIATNTTKDLFGERFIKNWFDMTYPNITTSMPQIAITNLNKLRGSYRDKRYNRNSEENIISLFKGQLDVYLGKDDDYLWLFHNENWHQYYAIDSLLFQNVDLPYEYLKFEANKNGDITTLYRNSNIGGLTVPVSYEKTKWYNSPQFVNEHYALIPIIIISSLLLLFIQILIKLISKIKNTESSKLFSNMFNAIVALLLLCFILNLFIGPLRLIKNPNDFLLGYPAGFKSAVLFIYLQIVLLGYWIILFAKEKMSIYSRVYFFALIISYIVHIIFLNYWSFL